MIYPLVSVVIPCFNHESFVKDSIQAVIDQSYKNIELIIIDDGSDDDSVQIIEDISKECEKRFVRFEFRHRPNKGLSATLNEALEWCQGKYFSVIASDDQMLPHKTEIQVEYIEKHDDVQAVMSSVNWINSNNEIISERKLSYKEYSFEDIFLSKQSLYACTQLSRLKSIKSIGGYKEGCPIEDWYMWLKLAQIGKLVNLDKVFVNYRLHDDNTIKKGEIIYKGMMEIAEEYKFHPRYLESIKRIMWIRVAAIITKDKFEGWVSFKNILKADPTAIFHKDFYRCVRNFIL